MSFSNDAETSILTHVFVGTALPWNGNTNLWLALHTADPGESGSLANEANYTSYARVTLTRASDITVSGNQILNTNLEQFPVCTGGSSVCTHVSIVTTASGAGTIIASGALNASVSVVNGIQPQFSAGALILSLD
jgi:hypothetical protein